MKLFVSPHNDDAVLFGAFTLMRDRPVVLTMLDSYLQAQRGFSSCGPTARRSEDEKAIGGVLGRELLFAGIPDDLPAADVEILIRESFRGFEGLTEVWLPAVEEGGHAHHNLVGEIGLEAFTGRCAVHEYLTYTERGKSTWGVPVGCNGSMVHRKMSALLCYETQFAIDALGCWPHFMRDQTEYVA